MIDIKDKDCTNGKRAASLNVRNISPEQIAYSPCGKMIYSGGHWDNSVRGYLVSERRTVFHKVNSSI